MKSRSDYGGQRSIRLMKLVYETYPPICYLGGEPIPEDQRTVEHIVPRSLGGTDDLENLRPACRHHNSARGNRPIEEWRATMTNETAWLLALRD